MPFVELNNSDINSETFTGPFTETVFTSDAINNTNSKAVQVLVKFNDIVPPAPVQNPDTGRDQLSKQGLLVVVEEELEQDIWNTIATQFEFIRNLEQPTEQLIELSPRLNLDRGIPEEVAIGDRIVQQINRTEGELIPGKDFRISLRIVPAPVPGALEPIDLQSVNVTAIYNLI